MTLFHLNEWQWLKTIAFMWLLALASNPGAVDGYFFPAGEKMRIEWIAPADDETSLLWGVAAKLRPECSFRRIEWYMGSRSGVSVPAAVNTGRSILRRDGSFKFGPWIVSVPASELAFNSYADVFHECRYLGFASPWLTKTRFFN